MKKFLASFIVLTGLLLTITLVQAKGGGGGGSSGGGERPACTVDTWTCSDWSACSVTGLQTRTCNLVSDCSDVETPKKPSESRSCTPPALPSPLVPKSSCTRDTFQCNGWGVCEEDGRQRRTCALANDCPSVNTALPSGEQACQGLRCGHLKTIRERVECRLKLTTSETKREQKILYSPEYCRIEETPQEKAECINLYWALERCWAMPAGQGRQDCGKEVTGINDPDLSGEELEEATEHWTLFQMYEYEFLGESLLKKGKVKTKDVVDLDVWVERQKAKLEKTEDPNVWEKLLKQTKTYWDKFLKQKVKK